jgi:hypothetical protein
MTKTKAHSTYWIDDTSLFDFSDDVNKEDMNISDGIDRIVKLATVRRAISNFVRILTNDSSIVVKYSSGQASYTDGKQVVISADDNPKNFDPMVGLALHEGSHCLLSDFKFLKELQDRSVFYRALHPRLRKMMKFKDVSQAKSMDYYGEMHDNDMAVDTLRKHLHTLMNVIEDRRIDSYIYRMAPGYRPYYDAMYNKYFFSSDVEKNLKFNPDWRKPTIENYINWLLLMFSPHFDQKALPGLGKMVGMIDLKNIRRFDEQHMPSVFLWKDSENTISGYNNVDIAVRPFVFEKLPLLWQVANELMIEILKRAQFHADEQDESPSDGNGEGFPFDSEMSDEEMQEMENEGMPNYDLPQKTFNENKAKKAIEKMKDMMDGIAKKKKIKKQEQDQVESMESAAADMSENSDPIFGKIPCLVTKKLNKQIMQSDWFPFSNRWSFETKNTFDPERSSSYRGFLAGIRMGQILAHKLQVRNEPQVTHFTRQEHGKIDRRILSQLGMDIENVFKRTTVDQYNPVLLYLSVDASGSMYGGKWERVMMVMTALAYAADKIKNLEVVITLRGNLGSGTPTVAVVYDSRKDNFTKAKALFPHLSSSGSTPEGLCYLATMELMQECAKTHTTYFINFSDGEPGCTFKHNGRNIDYGGYSAYKQTKNMVRQMRENGIRVMSYFINEYQMNDYNPTRVAFREMYGQDAEFVDVKNVVNVLKTVNKLLLVKE